MRPLIFREVQSIAEKINQTLLNSRLQEVKVGEKAVEFGFWREGQLFWLYCDLNIKCPLLLVLEKSEAHRVEKKVSPLLLFLRAHFLGRHLVQVKTDQDLGRVIGLEFSGSDGDGPQIEFRLFPHGQNIILTAEGKSVGWKKPKELEPIKETLEAEVPVRSYEELERQWQQEQSAKKGAGGRKASPEEELKKRKEKVVQAIQKVSADLKAKEESLWRSVGDWLSAHQTLEVPAEYLSYIDSTKSFAWNLQNCYEQAKDIEKKKRGTEERLNQLQSQLKELESVDPEAWWGLQRQRTRPQGESLLRAAQSRGRTLELAEGLKAYCGKSALDNLRLLREARAWDLWLHLKDLPSSHTIIRRNKNQRVKDESLREVGRWMIENNFGAKAKDYQGQKFELLVTEVRYVRPIKGDRMGRVNYSHERVLNLLYQP